MLCMFLQMFPQRMTRAILFWWHCGRTSLLCQNFHRSSGNDMTHRILFPCLMPLIDFPSVCKQHMETVKAIVQLDTTMSRKQDARNLAGRRALPWCFEQQFKGDYMRVHDYVLVLRFLFQILELHIPEILWLIMHLHHAHMSHCQTTIEDDGKLQVVTIIFGV